MRGVLSRASIKKLSEVLSILRYSKIKADGTEWRSGKFHLFIRQKGRRLILSLHADIPWSKPPYHRARREGNDLELEIQKIIGAYNKRRGVVPKKKK